MNFWIYLLIVEVIPLGLFIFGGLYESNSTKFNENKFGYKNQYSIKNKLAWEYSNKVAAQIFGSIGTLLFVVNTILLFMFREDVISFIIMFNLFMIILAKVLIDRFINKKFNSKS